MAFDAPHSPTSLPCSLAVGSVCTQAESDSLLFVVALCDDGNVEVVPLTLASPEEMVDSPSKVFPSADLRMVELRRHLGEAIAMRRRTGKARLAALNVRRLGLNGATNAGAGETFNDEASGQEASDQEASGHKASGQDKASGFGAYSLTGQPSHADILTAKAVSIETRVIESASETLMSSKREISKIEGGDIQTAMIFCAGLGTRLRPLTLEFPKPAVPFFDAPLIRYTMASLLRAGVRRLVINTHHLPDAMAEIAKQEAESAGFQSLSVSNEPVLMDTAGGLRDAYHRFMADERILLVNGDAFLSMDFRDAIRRHVQSGALASLCVAPPIPGENFRAIEADGTGRILKIRGIGSDRPNLIPWHFLGVHIIEPELLQFIRKTGPVDINGEVYPTAIAAGKLIKVLPVEVGGWADLGTPRRYYDASMEILSGGCDLSDFGGVSPLKNGVRLDENSFALNGADIAKDAILKDSIISGGARIEAGASVIRSILLPGAVIPAGQSVQDEILWPGGTMAIV